MDVLGRTWAEIDLGALAGNFAAIRSRCDQKIYAVVKADAYGHGAVACARALEKAGADGFAVSNLAEAEELREAGTSLPILILGYTPAEFAPALAKHKIAQCVFSLEYAEALNAAAEKAGVRVTAHLKLDTGMGRIGFDCRTENAPGLAGARQVLSLKNLDVTGVFAHFAVADTPAEDAFTQQQYHRFTAAVAALESGGHKFQIKHCRNSAATLALPEETTDAVRAGIILYGLSPSGDMTLPADFQPVMALYSTVSMVKTVADGESVSYGRTYKAQGMRKIATVSAGYADGVPRLLSNKGSVLIHGKRASIVGRVCMDQFCVDVTDIEDVKMGDTVTVFGPGVSVDEVAQAAETINYEVVCGISKRVPRVYQETTR